MERKKIAKSFWIKLVSVPVLMFFFAYAMVPIYDVLCDLTGFNGKTGTVETEQEYLVDEERLVSVSFFAATSSGFPVQFSPKVNLIPFNPFPETQYKTSNNKSIDKFQDILHRSGIRTTTRRTRGDDVDAACGQLAGKVLDKSRRNVGRN